MRGKSKTGMISQKAFPTWDLLEDMPTIIEEIPNNTIRNLLKLNLCCGYRIGELLNSYIFFDGDDKENILIRSVVEKKKDNKNFKLVNGKKRFDALHVMQSRGFLGKEYLDYNVKQKIWKSNKIINCFGLKMGWLGEYMSPSIYEPNYMFKYSYGGIYKLLKKHLPKMEVFYFQNMRLEEPVKVHMTPSFHFFRKAFCSRLVDYFPNSMDVVSYMKWGNVNQMLFYYKLYHDKDYSNGMEFEKNW